MADLPPRPQPVQRPLQPHIDLPEGSHVLDGVAVNGPRRIFTTAGRHVLNDRILIVADPAHSVQVL